ncbi:monocyte to macrophage differentiation factor isoform X2 [Puntigrus tetrazona]|uniref:monocyte to macrophage differentiation factor isoform X2 n=1 Tax=Puntigrus tetrazona TaxID=1606681 RepID=UPI001C8ABBD8|nr:monocyte to macrophage differentiation factor isoform X2 [Puntigrus tetrazona]
MKRVNSFQRFMNTRAAANCRYQPTRYEHAANCYTHALLIVPAFVGMALLHRLSDDRWERITAWVYGMGLIALFLVSTVFHIISWKKSHMRSMEHCFHMCDRVVIYFFIAASYTPWRCLFPRRLNLRELGPLAAHMRWFVWLMAAAGTIYVFNYHEKYKLVELAFYLTMGFFPALVVTSMARRLLHITSCTHQGHLHPSEDLLSRSRCDAVKRGSCFVMFSLCSVNVLVLRISFLALRVQTFKGTKQVFIRWCGFRRRLVLRPCFRLVG